MCLLVELTVRRGAELLPELLSLAEQSYAFYEDEKSKVHVKGAEGEREAVKNYVNFLLRCQFFPPCYTRHHWHSVSMRGRLSEELGWGGRENGIVFRPTFNFFVRLYSCTLRDET